MERIITDHQHTEATGQKIPAYIDRGNQLLRQVEHGDYSPDAIMDPDYRFAVSRKLAASTGCDSAILMDDVANAVDPSQRSALTGLPGYERAMIPAIPLAHAFDVHVITQSPPLPAEIEATLNLLGKVPDAKEYYVWVTGLDETYDAVTLFANDPVEYERRVRSTFVNLPKDDPAFHVKKVNEILKIPNIVRGKALLLPFQTTDWHHDQFAEHVKSGRAVLPDSTERWKSKAKAHQYFIDRGLEDLFPHIIHVNMSGRREVSEENIQVLTDNLIHACQAMKEEGKTPYVKVVSAGVSGIGNINPRFNPLLDSELRVGEREKEFADLVARKLADAQETPDALVEESIDINQDQLGRREFMISGIMINGTFHPWSVPRTLNTLDDIYIGAVSTPYPVEIGLTLHQHLQIANKGAQIAKAMAAGGYSTGYLSKDLIETNGFVSFHDHNDRRGGRSVSEVVGSLNGQGTLDRDYHMAIPEGVLDADFALETTQKLLKKGMIPYGTATTYYPECTNGTRSIKIKVIVPMKDLDSLIESGLSLIEAADTEVKKAVYEKSN